MGVVDSHTHINSVKIKTFRTVLEPHHEVKVYPNPTGTDNRRFVCKHCDKEVTNEYEQFYMHLRSCESFENDDDDNHVDFDILEYLYDYVSKARPERKDKVHIGNVLRQSLIIFACMSNLSVSHKSSDEFKNVIRGIQKYPLKQMFKILTKGSLEREMEALYIVFKDKIMSYLKSLISLYSPMNLAVDCWRSGTGEDVFGFVYYCVCVSYRLKQNELLQGKRGIDFARQTNEIISKLNPALRSKLGVLISDQASANLVMQELLTTRYPKLVFVPCFAHVVNLLMQYVLSAIESFKIVERCHNLALVF